LSLVLTFGRGKHGKITNLQINSEWIHSAKRYDWGHIDRSSSSRPTLKASLALLAAAASLHTTVASLHHALTSLGSIGLECIELLGVQEAARIVLERLLLNAQLASCALKVLSGPCCD